MKIQLKKAIQHKGQDIHTLDVPLENLTGQDLIDVEEQILRSGNPMQTTDFSRLYLISVASKAARIPVEILKQMTSHDFTRTVNAVRDFLIASDSEEIIGTAESPAKLPEVSSEG